ncbi:hypothetical protein T12_9251 [Trichinella patagoniensis]|uniref:Uncharacterized protein n=1 Tax=Trichinella patagoniensis TaxID=990121 RepID=A0A0V0ZEM3_9BILA|nr:hypothetical protein T12_9251 [Trichinella patagoniensis]
MASLDFVKLAWQYIRKRTLYKKKHQNQLENLNQVGVENLASQPIVHENDANSQKYLVTLDENEI